MTDEIELVPLRTNRLVPNGNSGNMILTPEGVEFQITPEWLSRFQDTSGEWLEDWPIIRAISICHFDNCGQYGIQLEILLAENVDGVFRAVCGSCGSTPDLYELP